MSQKDTTSSGRGSSGGAERQPRRSAVSLASSMGSGAISVVRSRRVTADVAEAREVVPLQAAGRLPVPAAGSAARRRGSIRPGGRPAAHSRSERTLACTASRQVAPPAPSGRAPCQPPAWPGAGTPPPTAPSGISRWSSCNKRRRTCRPAWRRLRECCFVFAFAGPGSPSGPHPGLQEWRTEGQLWLLAVVIATLRAFG